MATIKSYTDLEQSKKLAEILPLESADMVSPFRHTKNDEYISGYVVSRNYIEVYNEMMKLPGMEKKDICQLIQPAWSIAALLDVLPFHLIVNNQRYVFSMVKGLDKNGETYAIKYAIFNTTFYLHLTDFYNNPIDACVDMIEKLHELNLL